MSKTGKAGADTLPIQKRADEQQEESGVTTADPGKIQQGNDTATTEGGHVYTVDETRSYRLE